MNNTMPRNCPACGDEMHVRMLQCPSCRTEVQGEFSLDRFSHLSSVQLYFLETFIRCRGSLKDLGAEIGISYPTARSRLDSLIRDLGFGDAASVKKKRREILHMLYGGEITPDEAVTQLKELKGGQYHE